MKECDRILEFRTSDVVSSSCVLRQPWFEPAQGWIEEGHEFMRRVGTNSVLDTDTCVLSERSSCFLKYSVITIIY
jgi:hypothetical protein